MDQDSRIGADMLLPKVENGFEIYTIFVLRILTLTY